MPTYGQVPSQPDSNAVNINPWLKLAQDALSKSTTYFESNYQKQWEDSLRMFQSRHPAESKYNSEHYKYRSRLFRPKTRSMVRKHEATANMAYFSSPDIVSIDPANMDDQAQVASADINKELLDYRLTKSIPWYLTVLGGLQDAMSVGLVCSLQYWRYTVKNRKEKIPAYSPMFGQIEIEQTIQDVLEDYPCVELFPIENVRFDPAAKWYDVVRTSPYIILIMPVYLRDVLDRMEDEGPNRWKTVGKDVILQSRITTEDPVHLSRNDNKEDNLQQTSNVNEFDIIQVHLNFIKEGGEDWAFYTLKDKEILTDPIPVREMFKHCDEYGDRPVRIGFCSLETHKPVPMSPILIGKDLQTEANEIVNQRLDNVKLALNKRWVVRRGSNIDVDSLLRNVPGGVSMANNVTDDIREIEFNDVTSSAYAEQDRLNVDYDELLGSFAQSSVMTNRRMNETVGGMRLLAQGANVITEYTLRLYSETWMEPVLRQLIKMEQYYETDQVILGLVANKAQLYQKYGFDQITDILLRQELTLSVNVGMGATDPDSRFQRFLQAMGAYSKLATEGTPDLVLPEVRKELFGLAGFKNSAKFFGQVDPRLQQAQQMVQQAETMAKQVVEQAKMQLLERDRQQDKREMQLDLREMELTKDFNLELAKLQAEFIAEERQAQMQNVIEVNKARNQMGIEREKAMASIDLKAMQARSDARLKEFSARVDATLRTFLAKVEAQAKLQSQPKGKDSDRTQ